MSICVVAEFVPPSAAPVDELTSAQKIALLKMRRSDWSKAALRHLVAFHHADPSGADYRALAEMGLAVCCGSYHRLTAPGRWRADRVAVEIGREAGLHVLVKNLAPSHGRAASVKCICGWSAFRTRAIPSFCSSISRDAAYHIASVSR